MTGRATMRPSRPSRPTAHRFAARARRRRWLSLRPLLVGLGLVVLVGVLSWVVYGSRLLGVDRVVVTGTHRLSTADVLGAAEVPMHQPLASLDVAAVRSRVSALAPVASVHVVRDWPHTVRLAVVERTPVAVVRQGDAFLLVDGSGVAFGTVPRAPSGLPVLALAHPGPEDPATRAALAVATALPKALRARLTSVSATDPAAVTLALTGGVTVVWGDAAGTPHKAAVLTALMARQPGHVYDVSAPGVATVR